jgi:predicted porin
MASTDGIENWEIQRMNKKLLAVAVAGALGLPGVALAQSSVTISGFFKGGFESQKLDQYGAARAAGTNRSQTGVVDDSSRIIFNVREDLGGGLAAIGQVDMRIGLDSGAISAAGNNHVGLVSKNWGRLFFGRQDLHYFNRESDLTVRGTLRADSISLLAFAGGGGTAIAGATRTANVIHYTTPNWGGFTAILAYSANATGAEADLTAAPRKGRAWHFNPNYAASNWQIGYSYWSSKNDANATAASITGVPAVAGDQRGDRLYGSYTWGGLKLGFAWDKSKIRNDVAGLGTVSNRTAWSIPVQYRWGNHGVYAHYTKARDDKATAAQDGAKMWALSYAYDFSKRTSVALTYAKITNDVGAFYHPFTAVGLGVGVAQLAGEDPKVWGLTLRHAF